MMVFSMNRGGFTAVNVDTSGGRGVQISIAGQNPVGNASLVTNFSVEQAENFAISQCLNGGVYLYTFGHDPSNSHFSVQITSFLDSCDGSSVSDMAQAVSAYRSGRVSESKQLSTLTVGANGVFSGYLIGHGVHAADPAIGMVVTDYTFISLDAH